MKSDIVLIDAYSQIFRCFYAIAHLSNSKGEPTNALFAFTRLLLKLHEDFPDRDGALCFDCGKPAFRLELAADYKAGRPPMPEELVRQMPMLREMAEAFGWPLLQAENYEADDLIGGFASAIHDAKVFIVSSDKDLAQLVRPGVYWLAPDRKNSGFERRSCAEVVEKFGVPPEQIIDYLSLLGDSSDHIPGVPGVGAKTAAKILQAAPTLDAVLADPPETLSPKVRQTLQDNHARIHLNRQLIRLRTDLPAPLQDIPKALTCKAPDWEKIRRLCTELELKSILKDLPLDEFQFEAAAIPAPEVQKIAPAVEEAASVKVQGDLFG